MRGNGWRSVQEFLERTIPGGLGALRDILPEPTRTFINHSFDPDGWYDYFELEAVTRMASDFLGESHSMFLRQLADFTLKRDSNGIYRALLRFATPKLMVHAIPYTANRYYDFPQLTVHDISDKSCLIRVNGVPRAYAKTYMTLGNVYTIRALERTGARHVVCEASAPVSAGTSFGHEIAMFERRFSWTLVTP